MIGLNATCSIHRPTSSTNAYGEVTESVPATGTYTGVRTHKIEGRLNDRDRVEIDLGGQVQVATHKWIFEADEDVRVFDRIKHSGEYHKVLSVEDVDEWGHHLEVWTGRVEGVT